MIIVEAHSTKHQNMLEEEFSREGNFFAVPLKKTKFVDQLIDNMLFQIFLDHQKAKKDSKKKLQHKSVLVEKLKKMISRALENTICLSEVREIFEFVKHQEEKLELYEEHILHLNRLIMNEDDSMGKLNNLDDLEFEGMFQDALQYKKRSVRTLESEMTGVDSGEGLRIKTAEKIRKVEEDHFQSLKLIEEDDSHEQTTNTLQSNRKRTQSHSLRLQIPQTPHYKQSLEEIMCSKKSASKRFLDQSYEEGDEQSSSYQQEEVKSKKYSITYDMTTNSTFYRPSWKKQSDENLKSLQRAISGEESVKDEKKSMSDSEFLENLSGRFKPLPSILNDVSITDMIKREKKEDIKKSNIFKESLKGYGEQINTERIYSENIRMVKMQQKLNFHKRKSPRNMKEKEDKKEGKKVSPEKNNNLKRELRQVKSTGNLPQVTPQKEEKAEQGKNGVFSSLSNLFRFKKAPA